VTIVGKSTDGRFAQQVSGALLVFDHRLDGPDRAWTSPFTFGWCSAIGGHGVLLACSPLDLLVGVHWLKEKTDGWFFVLVCSPIISYWRFELTTPDE
jgi:hypothetical protein